MLQTINKNALIDIILANLNDELAQTINAANDAHAAAVDDESVAETQYDTLAIEAGYLAEGQSKRVIAFQQAIASFTAIKPITFNENCKIALTALVQLSADIDAEHWFFIAPAAGGFRCQFKQQDKLINITVITPSSPMALALLDKQQDDDIEIMQGNGKLTDYIARVL